MRRDDGLAYPNKLRSLSELKFRALQEIGNLVLLARRPSIRELPGRLHPLPDPAPVVERLRGTEFARQIERIADGVLEGRFELLSYSVNAGAAIDWRRDYVHNVSSGTRYFRRVRYLDFAEVGDHKVVWELNRHQHLVVLAQAYLLTERGVYLDCIANHLQSWFAANPYARGVNWTSALEIAFRAFSWIWTYHLVGEKVEPALRRRWLAELDRHGCYLERNLSFYFSPNTHLLGEALCLYALGVLFPQFQRSAPWTRTGREVTLRQFERQVGTDGSHFENSSYYHVYALDMFLFFYLLAGRPKELEPRLEQMAEYLEALMGPARVLPLLGDDDGGRFFHPYGDRTRFGRATLATCASLWRRDEWTGEEIDTHEQAAWWLGETAFQTAAPSGSAEKGSTLFRQAGIAVLRCGPANILVDAGPFGGDSGGHSHSDTLSVVASYGGQEILTDSGTFIYLGDRRQRDWFRGSAAHNTLRVDRRNQANSNRAFGWTDRPNVEIAAWSSTPETDYLDAFCRYDSIVLRRRLLFLKPALLLILDTVEGPPGEHDVEQFWHLASRQAARHLATSRPGKMEEGGENGWRSTAYGSKQATPALCVSLRGPLPVGLAAAVDLTPEAGSDLVELTRDDLLWRVRNQGRQDVTAEFPDTGEFPRIRCAGAATEKMRPC